MKVELEVKCDNCDSTILVSSKTIEERRKIYVLKLKDGTEVDDMLYISYFKCASCGERFIFMIEDFAQIKLMKSRDAALSKANRYNRCNVDIPKDLMFKINELNREINERNEILVEKYSKAIYKFSLFSDETLQLCFYGGDPTRTSVKTLKGEEKK